MAYRPADDFLIAGATRGSGGRALAAHLASERNDRVEIGDSRGLVSDPADIQAQMRELRDLASHGRTDRPIHHVHADPPPGCTDEAAVRVTFWRHYEKEFGLERAPFLSRIHEKDGRRHEHRAYSLVRSDGGVADLSHDYARREKVSRITEAECGLPMVAGKHNRAVAHALDRDGRADVVKAMRAAGLLDRARPVAPLAPKERAQQERTEIRRADVGAAVLEAWRASDSGAAFAAALAERGFRLAEGDRVSVVVDASGNAHPVARLLGTESKAGGGDRIAAADVRERLAGVHLPRHEPGVAPMGDRAPTVPATQDPTPAAEAAPASPVVTPVPVPAVEAMPSPAAAPEPTALPAAGAAPAAAPTPEQPQAVPAAGGGRAAPSTARAPGSDGGSAPASVDGDTVASIDPSKPDDVARFLREWAAAERMRQARAAASGKQQGGQHHGNAHDVHAGQRIRSLADEIRADLDQVRADRRGRDLAAQLGTAATAPGLDGQHGFGADRGHDGGQSDSRPPPVTGRPGDGPGDFRRAADGEHDRRLDAAPPAAGGRGEGSAPADPRPPRGDVGRHHQDRGAPGRIRVQARRASRHLADAVEARGDRLARLTEALQRPPTAVGLALDALRRDAELIASTLATEPFRDPDACDPRAIASDLADQVVRQQDMAEQSAATAMERARKARGHLSLFDRLTALVGVPTAIARTAAAADEEADRLRLAASAGHNDLRRDILDAAGRAPSVTAARRRERAAWRVRPEIADALERQRLNWAVEQAIEEGDPAITAQAASGDLNAARNGIRLLEEAHRRHEERIPPPVARAVDLSMPRPGPRLS